MPICEAFVILSSEVPLKARGFKMLLQGCPRFILLLSFAASLYHFLSLTGLLVASVMMGSLSVYCFKIQWEGCTVVASDEHDGHPKLLWVVLTKEEIGDHKSETKIFQINILQTELKLILILWHHFK